MSKNKIIVWCDSPWVDNKGNDNINKNVAKPESDIDVISNCIIKGGTWVFLSNKIVAYWPFSVKSSNENKILTFRILSLALSIVILCIVINLLQLVHFFLYEVKDISDFHEYQLDTICMISWVLLMISCFIIARIYGVLALSKFETFWEQILNIVAQCSSLTFHKETENKFAQLKKWGMKWFMLFILLGIITTCVSFVYNFTTQADNVMSIISCVTLSMITCAHTSNTFLLLFFIKIITHGFSVCSMEIEKLAPKCIPPLFSKCEQQRKTRSTKLEQIFKLLNDAEHCTSLFNNLFGLNLFVDTILCLATIMIALFSLQLETAPLFVAYVILLILMFSICFTSLCVAGSQLTKECLGMARIFQEIPSNSILPEDAHKIQLIVQRISARPSGIYVAHLYQIQRSLLCSALNVLATYFVVLIQLRPSAGIPLTDIKNQTNQSSALLIAEKSS